MQWVFSFGKTKKYIIYQNNSNFWLFLNFNLLAQNIIINKFINNQKFELFWYINYFLVLPNEYTHCILIFSYAYTDWRVGNEHTFSFSWWTKKKPLWYKHSICVLTCRNGTYSTGQSYTVTVLWCSAYASLKQCRSVWEVLYLATPHNLTQSIIQSE